MSSFVYSAKKKLRIPAAGGYDIPMNSRNESVEIAVRKIAIIASLTFGASHIFQSGVWAAFFIDLHAKGEIGSFYTALINFPAGLLIASFHNVWRGTPLLLTLMGWALVLKGILYFLFPMYGLKMLGHVSMERSWEFIVAGALLVGFACILISSLRRTPKTI
jgi:hypothetical protein